MSHAVPPELMKAEVTKHQEHLFRPLRRPDPLGDEWRSHSRKEGRCPLLMTLVLIFESSGDFLGPDLHDLGAGQSVATRGVRLK